MREAVVELLYHNPFRRRFLIFLIVVNLLGSIYGFYWYRGQLQETPVYLWLFTFDSPLSVILFSAALLGYLLRFENKLLHLIGYTGVIKFGIWASVVILDFWIVGGGTPTFVVAMLLLSHLGMALEGFVFIRHFHYPLRTIVALAFWFGIGDYLDYVVGIHPWLYYPGQARTAAVTAVVLSIFLLLYVVSRKRESRRFIFRQ